MGMIIQGSHMNYGFMQQLAAKKRQGESLGDAEALLQKPGMRLGQGLNVNPAKSGLTPAADALAKAPGQQGKLPENFPGTQDGELTLGATVANEIARRIEAQTEEGQETKDTTALQHALGETMDWVRERFGDETAAAASGMVLAATSSTVNEDTLGDGLLNALKFIDRNFGVAAGDAAIAQFNQSVNVELNSYFENGKMELFHASTTSVSVDEPSATQDLTARLFTRTTQASDKNEDAKSPTELLLEELKKELDNTAELQDLTTQLEEKFNPTKAATNAAMAAYTDPAAPMEPQLASIAV
ncbi:hypothetical protein [Pseudodesulfovibrio sp. zrk46]|uniref:hypothetical protein n=1 Tax=Pseudodesulfovibrio sp. zrk46 TaxID=2725288 RepID=UPI0014496815|nr:hypothetical protein [Pseudodesulfovibrio sp. zrk46]QJB55718.1 hypothetical protein HFN16_04580 [Pseudodesulfovibrio sp. zrk46]